MFRIIDDLSIALDRARRVVSNTRIFRIDTVKRLNIGRFCSNMRAEFY
jgi:hypothetical protein